MVGKGWGKCNDSGTVPSFPDPLRKSPWVDLGWAVFYTGYFDFLHQLQVASHNLVYPAPLKAKYSSALSKYFCPLTVAVIQTTGAEKKITID